MTLMRSQRITELKVSSSVSMALSNDQEILVDEVLNHTASNQDE